MRIKKREATESLRVVQCALDKEGLAVNHGALELIPVQLRNNLAAELATAELEAATKQAQTRQLEAALAKAKKVDKPKEPAASRALTRLWTAIGVKEWHGGNKESA